MENLSEFFTNAMLIKTLVAGLVAFFIVLLLVVISLIVIASVSARLLQKSGRKKKKSISIEDLGRNLENYSMQVKRKTLNKKSLDKLIKNQRNKQKDQEKKNVYGPIAFVIDFEGDIKASQVSSLREEISTILEVADSKKDEIVVRLESRGGAVHGYGLAASQLQRIRDKKIPLTICVDKVAASGGYMMACIANRIIAAPFAIVGSIGVISQVPNLHRFLKSKDIDYEEMTSGEFKRTVSIFGEISEKGRKKHLQDIEDIHLLFKDHVKNHRPSLNISKVSTGEYWYGIRAKELGLVDELLSSDDYIARLLKDNKKVYKVSLDVQKSLVEKLGHKAAQFSLVNRMLNNTQPYDMKGTNIFPEHFM